MSNPKSLLGEWSQGKGMGPFQNTFRLSFDVVGEQHFRARVLYRDTGEELAGEPSVGKRATERDACRKMYRHVTQAQAQAPQGVLNRDIWAPIKAPAPPPAADWLGTFLRPSCGSRARLMYACMHAYMRTAQ